MLNLPVLVLNQNYEPLNLCSKRRAVVLVLNERAQILENGLGMFHSTASNFPIPSVIRLFHLVRRPIPIRRLSRREVFLRDGYTCQYCGLITKNLTLDHVIPRVRGGTHVWDNIVSACSKCNHRKAGRTPKEAGMLLMKETKAPAAHPYAMFFHRPILDEWRKFMPWMAGVPVSSDKAVAAG